MRKRLLALAAVELVGATVLLLLATLEVSPAQTLPLGVLAGFGGVATVLGVMLLGQRALMERTSKMARQLNASRDAAAKPGKAPADMQKVIRTALRESNEALAWSLDARIVGLAEHLASDKRQQPNLDDD